MQKRSGWWEKTAAWEEWRRRLTGYYSPQLKPQTGWKREEFLQLSLSFMQKSLHTFTPGHFKTRNGDWLVCLDSTGNPMRNNPDPLSLLAHSLTALTSTLPLRHWALQSVQSPQSWGVPTTKMEAEKIPQRLFHTSASYTRPTDSWLDPLCAPEIKLQGL